MRREQQTLGGGSIELCYQIVSARGEERAATLGMNIERAANPNTIHLYTTLLLWYF